MNHLKYKYAGDTVFVCLYSMATEVHMHLLCCENRRDKRF